MPMLKRTPLHDAHVSIGARMVEFAGWEMPVQYTSHVQEHMAVRQAAGLFDVSHMGEIEITGDDALALVQRVTTNDASKLQDNQVQYSTLTNETGGVLDDLLVYRINAEYFLLIVNAGPADSDFDWIKRHASALNCEAHNTSSGYALLALQGPRAERILQQISDHMLDRIPYYWSQRVQVDGIDSRVSRTGYTGEDGFEILCKAADARHVWNRLLVTGQDRGLAPCGLAARNTLRLEAAYRLYGNDMDETTTPLEAGLGWVVKLGKGNFIGRDALARQREQGSKRKLVGFEVLDRAPARDSYPIVIEGQQAGVVTSGSPAPFLKKNIGLAYLPIEHTPVGTEFSVVIRGRNVPARVVETPFYKRERTFD
ncbi:MAG TPA: glycine cleavage system aminomethyltransferase GcvT [Blastocatellia bacterium]|nr:glycine cleavage system aminomethyltransferase GcvT [Blastocatellia bacterium]